MKKQLYFITYFRKVLSLIISAMILLNVFGIIIINNAEKIGASNKYAKDTITKCCNLTVIIPLKIVNSFFNMNTADNIAKQVPLRTTESEKKNQKDKNNKTFFQCAVFEDTSFFNAAGTGKNITQGALLNSYQDYISSSDVNSVILLSLLFVVLFGGNMILARGDTENITKKINNILKKEFVLYR